MSQGKLSSLGAGAFTGLTNLKLLAMAVNDLSSLNAGVFSDLTSLTTLHLRDNDLEELTGGVFSGLTALTWLDLEGNDLEELTAGVFSSLTSLTRLNLEGNDLEELRAGAFNGLTSLTRLNLHDNDLEELRAGVFSGLTGLTNFTLGDNPDTGDTLPLTVTVEKVGTDQARAEVPAGAPFAVDFTPAVVNGSLPASDTKLAVAAGSVEGTPVTVTRTSGTTAPVTVDIDLTTQPTLPLAHTGYEFVKATSGLPKEILSDDPNNDPVFDPASVTFQVPENSPPDTRVALLVRATDADTGDTLTYSMEGMDAASFAFATSTVIITTIAGVDYNYEATKNSYSVTVKVEDGNGGSDTVAVTIDVTDVEREIGHAGQADAGGGRRLVDDPDGELGGAGPQRRPRHHRLRPAVPRGRDGHVGRTSRTPARRSPRRSRG